MHLCKQSVRTWFSHLLRHPARKLGGSILTTPDTARGKTRTKSSSSSDSSILYVSPKQKHNSWFSFKQSQI